MRHPGGGRKDILRWTGADGRPATELEIYRPGGEFDAAASPAADLAARMGLGAASPLQEAGLIDSKFGPVALVRPGGGPTPCLGYLRRVEEPSLLISGWSCQGRTLPARRAAIACTLDRLTLLSAGHDPKLAELFARAELRRRGCGPAGGADWLTGAETAQLRGTL
jgi:hypothetical protein